MTRGVRAQSSRTVLRPSVMTSGRARSVTNASTSCRSTGASASGGTSSWHACEADGHDPQELSDPHINTETEYET